ncbi:MAG: D-alanine--D-alanine ligase [Erysipelotrichaceae bacterium]|nr:D-alanine--D-alanine ligase [Erysipelotrichaceae bacterium]
MSVRIAVLFGGQSHEHPVSCMSVTSVLNNLDSKYDVYMVGITMDGNWYHYCDDVALIENDKWLNSDNKEEIILSPNPNHHGFYNLTTGRIDRVDMIFPMLHGRNGEDGTVQGLCQLANIPCVSCDLTSSAIAMDKEFTHIIAESYGVPMARYKVFRKNNHPDYTEMYEMVTSELGLPCYVKPSKEGSSFGAHKINNFNDFTKYTDDAFSYDEKILFEEFISGTEVGCGVMADGECGLVYEVVVETEMYGYAEKYDGYKTNIYVPAINLTDEQMAEVVRYSKIVYKALGCNVLGRADFFASDRIIFNEINLIPGFTSHSLFPATFKAKGIDYTTMLNKLIELKLEEE